MRYIPTNFVKYHFLSTLSWLALTYPFMDLQITIMGLSVFGWPCCLGCWLIERYHSSLKMTKFLCKFWEVHSRNSRALPRSRRAASAAATKVCGAAKRALTRHIQKTIWKLKEEAKARESQDCCWDWCSWRTLPRIILNNFSTLYYSTNLMLNPPASKIIQHPADQQQQPLPDQLKTFN